MEALLEKQRDEQLKSEEFDNMTEAQREKEMKKRDAIAKEIDNNNEEEDGGGESKDIFDEGIHVMMLSHLERLLLECDCNTLFRTSIKLMSYFTPTHDEFTISVSLCGRRIFELITCSDFERYNHLFYSRALEELRGEFIPNVRQLAEEEEEMKLAKEEEEEEKANRGKKGGSKKSRQLAKQKKKEEAARRKKLRNSDNEDEEDVLEPEIPHPSEFNFQMGSKLKLLLDEEREVLVDDLLLFTLDD